MRGALDTNRYVDLRKGVAATGHSNSHQCNASGGPRPRANLMLHARDKQFDLLPRLARA